MFTSAPTQQQQQDFGIDLRFAMEKHSNDTAFAVNLIEDCLPEFIRYHIAIIRSLGNGNNDEAKTYLTHMSAAAVQFGAHDLTAASDKLLHKVERNMPVKAADMDGFEAEFEDFMNSAWDIIIQFHGLPKRAKN